MINHFNIHKTWLKCKFFWRVVIWICLSLELPILWLKINAWSPSITYTCYNFSNITLLSWTHWTHQGYFVILRGYQNWRLQNNFCPIVICVEALCRNDDGCSLCLTFWQMGSNNIVAPHLSKLPVKNMTNDHWIHSL